LKILNNEINLFGKKKFDAIETLLIKKKYYPQKKKNLLVIQNILPRDARLKMKL